MFLCLPALFLTFGKVNGAKIDRFFWGGGWFLTLGKVNGAKIDRFFFGEGWFLTFGKVNGAKIDRFFLGGGFLTLGKVNCHRHGWGSVPESTVFPGRGGGVQI